MKSAIYLAILTCLSCQSLIHAGDDRLKKWSDSRYYPCVAEPQIVVDVDTEPTPSLFGNWANYAKGGIPIRKSISFNYGLSYDPTDNDDMLLTSFQWTCKYKDFWLNDAPDDMTFRLELAGGARLRTEERGVFSCGIFVQRYLSFWANGTFRPYFDAGVGIIYTDFQNEKQGLRVNFNPRVSIGTDMTIGDSTYFMAFRLFHVSNSGLHHDNRGINGTMLVFGKYF